MFDDVNTNPQTNDTEVNPQTNDTEVNPQANNMETVSWEKVTGLSAPTLLNLMQSHKLMNRVNSSLPKGVLDSIRPPVGILNSIRPSVDFAALVRPSMDFAALVRPSVDFAALVRPSVDFAALVRPSVADIGSLFTVTNPLAGMRDSLALLSGSLMGISQYFDWIGSFTSAFGSIKAWMPNNFKRLEEKLRLSILAALERAGLCLAPSMSEDLMHQIAWYANKGDLRPVTLLVWHYYADHDHARLRQAVSRWWNNPDFVVRRNFIDAALKTHVQGIYEASISTLISHIEGIASAFFYESVIKKSINNNGLRLGKTEKIVLHMLNVAGDVPNLDASVSGFMGWIMVKSIVQYVQNVLYRSFDFGLEFEKVQKSRVLNRHGPSHGIQLGHATAMNSLRTFLLFDIIHYILESYKNNGKVIWH